MKIIEEIKNMNTNELSDFIEKIINGGFDYIDNETCKHCKYSEILQEKILVFGKQKVVTKYKCNIDECKYLNESKKETIKRWLEQDVNN